MKSPLFFLLALLSLTLPACGDESPYSPEVKALIKQTLKHMVYVEGGSFVMGDVGYEVPETNPQGEWVPMADGSMSYRMPFGCDMDCIERHKVTLSGFYLNQYETTYAEYDTYTEANGLPLVREDLRGRSRFIEKEYPVNLGVNWYDAQAYCQWLGKITGLPFDLPTEAQWEYAARSRGMAVRYATDNGELEPGRNYRPHHHGIQPDPPGTYPPNPLGLYDMTGNVNEWVRDWYIPNYYLHSPEKNPIGPSEERSGVKVSRGFGTANSDWTANTVFRRISRPPEFTGGNGFRCAIHSEEPLPRWSALPVEGVESTLK
ncbi:formylglycine-generating enzyme family protein [Gynuella sunshinyii]|uniref:Sulfatase-modifying factor enzyme-like domain-containing protein n=1 Tax=Gynuella sunshinyii YC6258 TaxID=1445510 RepID=A0A0C5VX68_9GAMM|nr:SUMF1/EgtB/PvdO family nonheme iron enzyme [Gynuella sunshinyii]AJQ97923.1 hypothetical protein YC6258_05895 [Gynuella sunshinyii YC6258]